MKGKEWHVRPVLCAERLLRTGRIQTLDSVCQSVKGMMVGLVFPSSKEQIDVDRFEPDLPVLKGIFVVQSNRE